MDILKVQPDALGRHIVVGGGGLLAKTFHQHMIRLSEHRRNMATLVAWGLGESENVDRGGGFVLPYTGPMPEYLKSFDLVGVRDFGAEYRWVPCASCMLPHFNRHYEIEHEIAIYEHKRIPIPIEGFVRRTNNGNDIDATIAFLASARLIITNSYHGAFWATLLGRRVICIPNMSKMYRFKHMPVICRPEDWKRNLDNTVEYPNALDECRKANGEFYGDVLALQSGANSRNP